MHPRLGGNLDPRLLPGFRLAKPQGPIGARRRELCSQSEPVSRALAVCRSRRQEMAIAGSTQHGRLRVERRRFARAWAVPGYGSVADVCILDGKHQRLMPYGPYDGSRRQSTANQRAIPLVPGFCYNPDLWSPRVRRTAIMFLRRFAFVCIFLSPLVAAAEPVTKLKLDGHGFPLPEGAVSRLGNLHYAQADKINALAL